MSHLPVPYSALVACRWQLAPTNTSNAYTCCVLLLVPACSLALLSIPAQPWFMMNSVSSRIRSLSTSSLYLLITSDHMLSQKNRRMHVQHSSGLTCSRRAAHSTQQTRRVRSKPPTRIANTPQQLVLHIPPAPNVVKQHALEGIIQQRIDGEIARCGVVPARCCP